MAFITFRNDRARKLKFGFNAMGYMQSVHGISDIQAFVVSLQKGNVYNIVVLIDSCLAGDNEGITKEKLNDSLDDFIEDHGMDKLGEIINATIEESAIFKDQAKKKLVQEKKQRK